MRKILLVPDVSNWAWGIKARAIRDNLNNIFDIDIAYQSHGTPKFNINMINKYDHIHFFDWRYAIKHIKYNDKISTSIASIEFIIKDKDRLDRLDALKYIKIVAVSEEIANVLEKNKLGKEIHRCFNGVNEELFKPNKEIRKKYGNKFRIGLMCKPPSNYDIHGHKLMKKVRDELQKDEEIECDFIIANYKTASKTHEQMVEYYNSLDIFIHTGRYHLSTPNPYFEAASCGIVTIGTTNGCIPFLTDNFKNGFTIDIEKSDDKKTEEFVSIIKFLKLDRKINKLYNREDLCSIIGKNIRKSILNSWTWKERAKYWINLFNK